MTKNLLPCPFCGTAAEMQPWHGGAPTKQVIMCVGREDVCDVGPMVTGETPEEAAANWNRRAPAPKQSLRGIVAAFLRAHDDGPGLIDCLDNHGNRYTSQLLGDTIDKARAALAATEGSTE